MIRVAVVRRCRRRRASFGAVALSIFLLGLLDSAALTPLAYAPRSSRDVGGWLRAGLLVVAVAGVLAAAVVLGLPRLRVCGRSRASGSPPSLREHATGPREAIVAWAAVATSWALRALAVFVLLDALALGTDFALALAFVCASVGVGRAAGRARGRACRPAPARRSSSPRACTGTRSLSAWRPRRCDRGGRGGVLALAAWHLQAVWPRRAPSLLKPPPSGA